MGKLDDLISNEHTQFTEEDRPWLEVLHEDQLARMVPVVDNDGEGDDEPPTEAEVLANAADDTIKAEAQKRGLLATNQEETPPVLSNEDRAALDYGKLALNQRRQTLTSTITANKRNKYTAEQLAAKDLPELEALAELAGGVPDFSANTGGLPRVNDQVEVLGPANAE